MGHLLLSKSAINELLRLDRSFYMVDPVEDSSYNNSVIRGDAEECLNSLTEIAKDDLKVNSKKWFLL